MKDILNYIISNRILKKLTLSKSINKDIIRTVGRLTEIKGEIYLALESFHTDGKAIQKNYPEGEAVDMLVDMIPEQYKEMNIITTNGNCEVKASRKGKITVFDHIKREEAQAVIMEHNRQKKYIIPSDRPVDFLVELGVQDSKGRIYDKKRSKFRQINRFLEIVSDVENDIIKGAGDELYILDLCCGKSYLSFAIYYYFTQIKNRKVIMDCVDLKKDVMEYCSGVAGRLNYSGLHFAAGDINAFEIRKQPDLTVSLHACDIATDIVIAKGIDSQSKVILSTPCCHHEMMHQLKPQGTAMDFLLEHSILKQKFADAATDALRCKMLQIKGYEVNAIELIDPEETPKNVIIRAVRHSNMYVKRTEKLIEEYRSICDMFGIKPYLWNHYFKGQ